MNDDDESGRPSEGQPAEKSGGKSGGCGGCLFPLIIGALLVYCTVDVDDFYLAPGEANLWMDAMEVVFDNVEEATPDSLFIDDPLEPLDHMDYYINKHNYVYGLHPFIKVRSKADEERVYIMRVLGIVRHAGPNDFQLSRIEIDTLIQIPGKQPLAP